MSPEDKKLFPGQMDPADDPVNHPSHYTTHPSGVEMTDIAEHYNFCLGNVIKYIWRAGLKDGTAEGEIEDLKKARWYLEREIHRREAQQNRTKVQASIRVSGVPYPVDQDALQRMRGAEEDEHFGL